MQVDGWGRDYRYRLIPVGRGRDRVAAVDALRDSLQQLLEIVPQDPRLWVRLVGAALLLVGARVYRLAVIGPGFVAGVFVGLELTSGQSSEIQLATTLILGIGGAALLHMLERFAVALTGGIVAGGLVHAAAPLILGGPAPWYVPTVASLLGFLALPRVMDRLLPLITSLVGALAVAWSVDRTHDLVFIRVLTTVGLAIQLLVRRGGGKGKSKGDG